MSAQTPTPRPRIDAARRLVMIYSPGLQAWTLNRVATDGRAARNFATLFSFEQDPSKAANAMGYTYAGFLAVNGMAGRAFDTHHAQVAAVWAEGQRQQLAAQAQRLASRPNMGSSNGKPWEQ